MWLVDTYCTFVVVFQSCPASVWNIVAKLQRDVGRERVCFSHTTLARFSFVIIIHLFRGALQIHTQAWNPSTLKFLLESPPRLWFLIYYIYMLQWELNLDQCETCLLTQSMQCIILTNHPRLGDLLKVPPRTLVCLHDAPTLTSAYVCDKNISQAGCLHKHAASAMKSSVFVPACISTCSVCFIFSESESVHVLLIIITMCQYA